MHSEIEYDHIATGSESLLEFARNAGQDQPDRCWLLDSRDVWVRNPWFSGTDTTHPDDNDDDDIRNRWDGLSWQDQAEHGTESICIGLWFADLLREEAARREEAREEAAREPFTLF